MRTQVSSFSSRALDPTVLALGPGQKAGRPGEEPPRGQILNSSGRVPLLCCPYTCKGASCTLRPTSLCPCQPWAGSDLVVGGFLGPSPLGFFQSSQNCPVGRTGRKEQLVLDELKGKALQ